MILFHADMSTGRITGRQTRPRRRVYYWCWVNGRSMNWLMVWHMSIIIDPLLKGLHSCDTFLVSSFSPWDSLYQFPIMDILQLIFGTAGFIISDKLKILWTVLYIGGIFLRNVSGIPGKHYRFFCGTCSGKDWTLVPLCLFGPIWLILNTQCCVSTKCNFVLERWNEIMLFSQEKKCKLKWSKCNVILFSMNPY